MTEERPRWIQEELRKEELRQQRQRWEEARKAEAERKERQEKQAELQRYLQRRAQAWEATTGSVPTSEEMLRWQRHYLDEQEKIHQAERDKAVAEYDASMGFRGGSS